MRSLKIPPFSALVCSHPLLAHLIKDKDKYFGGLQGDIYNSFCPKKYLKLVFKYLIYLIFFLIF